MLNQDWSPSAEIIPGVSDVVDWNLVSPRLGMAYQIGDRQVLRAFYGKFFDADVTGNWYAPPPNPPGYLYEYGPSLDGPWTYSSSFEYHGNLFHPNLQAPETDQFTVGWERRLGDNFTLGIQGVFKEAKNLIGWEILDDGVYEEVPWTNPFSGETEQLYSVLEQPTTRKGNRPGDGSKAAPGTSYNQDYEGVVLTLNRRYSDGWSLQSSYTLVQIDRLHSAAVVAVSGQPVLRLDRRTRPEQLDQRRPGAPERPRARPPVPGQLRTAVEDDRHRDLQLHDGQALQCAN